MFAESMQNTSDGDSVSFVVVIAGVSGFGRDDHIIDIGVGIAASNVEDEYVVHHVLESSRGVIQTKRHDLPFVTPNGGCEGGLPFVSFLDSNVVITGSNVEFRKSSTTLPFVDELRDEWEGVRILDCDRVELAVVDDHSKFSVFLGDKKARGGKRGL